MSEQERQHALPSFSGASRSIGTFLAGLEQQILHKRPPAATVIEEQDRMERSSVNGVTVHLPDEPIASRATRPQRRTALTPASCAPIEYCRGFYN